MARSTRLGPLFLAAVIGLGPLGCDRSVEETPAPVRTEVDQQVNRLRRDNEIEMNDLRGRWVAAHGLLSRQRDELEKLARAHQSNDDELRSRLARIEADMSLLSEDLSALRLAAQERQRPVDSTLHRLARSYEEIYCLRKRGADEQVAAVYERYGFEDVEAWAEAWAMAARSESFEREVSRRVEQLCP